MSPLHPDGWFSLGYCAMKTQRHDRALQVAPLHHSLLLRLLLGKSYLSTVN